MVLISELSTFLRCTTIIQSIPPQKLECLTLGLQAVFNEDLQSGAVGTTTLLVLSILWSFKTTITTYNSIKSAEKDGFLGFNAKCVLGLRSFLCTVTRIACIILFFAPFLGLLNLMAHWKAEQLSFEPPDGIDILNDNFTYWNSELEAIESIPFKDLYRLDYSVDPPQPPSISFYTGLKLKWAYLVFFILLLTQALIMFGCKYLTNEKFRQGTFTMKIRRTFQTIHVPDTVSDWDEVDGDVDCHKERWRQTMVEMTIMIVIQFVVNMLMLTPLLYSGSIRLNNIL